MIKRKTLMTFFGLTAVVATCFHRTIERDEPRAPLLRTFTAEHDVGPGSFGRKRWVMMASLGNDPQSGGQPRGQRDPRPDRTPPAGPPPRGGRGPGPMWTLSLVKKYDIDADGKLNDEERREARKEAKEVERAPFRFSDRGESPEPGESLSPDQVTHYPKADLYDINVLRTLFLEFEDSDWESELADFWHTDVELPARMVVDGKEFREVGVRFRGSSSFFTVGTGKKRSLNIAVDYGDGKQRLYGYKTLDLLNSHTDPTYVRTALFNHIAGHYLPTPKVNFVRLVINGESWGVYVNSQQFNKDFLAEWFGTRQGVRWKMGPNPRGGNGFGYLGDDRDAYGLFKLRTTTDEDRAWDDFIRLCKTLNRTPSNQLVAALDPIFNLDRALWFLAVENIFCDGDGYWVRSSDFTFYQGRDGRFQMIPHDSNETFNAPGGGVPAEGVRLDPLTGIDDESKPLISKLLAVPELKARYLAHVRTIAEEWLHWDRIRPITEQYQSLIVADVKKDTHKLYDSELFAKGLTETYVEEGRRGPREKLSIKDFVTRRRDALLSHPGIDRPTPTISSVAVRGTGAGGIPLAADSVEIIAELSGAVQPKTVRLYYSPDREARYTSAPMTQLSGGQYQATVGPRPAGSLVYYYVEAQADESTVFYPRGAEFAALRYRVAAPLATESPVVINELMASNVSGLKDPQGDRDDWIELYNQSDHDVDLAGMFLSDDPDNPRKWRMPVGTILGAGKYLLAWADEDGKAGEGLHVNFKLSKAGEQITLSDTDANGNRILDSVKFGAQEDDVAYARTPNATGEMKHTTSPTPNQPNG